MIWTLVTILFAFFANITGGVSIPLNPTNFDDKILDEGPWMIKFFSPRCIHCNNLAPNWSEASDVLKGRMNFGEVDCTVHNSLCQRFSIRGYPTIKLFKGKDSLNSPINYSGSRDVNSLVEYAEANSVSKITVERITGDNFETLCPINANVVCLLSFLPKEESVEKIDFTKYMKTLKDAAKLSHSYVRFMYVIAGDFPEVEKLFKIDKVYPSAVEFRRSKGLFTKLILSFNLNNIKKFANMATSAGGSAFEKFDDEELVSLFSSYSSDL